MEEHLKKSSDLIQWLDTQIDGLPFRADTRTRLVAGCFDIAMEHYKAIILLSFNKVYGSAYSLLRPLFESYIRGLWLFRCASKTEVELFQKGKITKNFGQLIEEIEKIDGYDIGTLSKSKRASWGAMNDYVHSGFNQITRRNKENSIEPNYDIEEIKEIICFANSIGVLSAIEISFISENKKLSSELLEKMKNIGSWGA